MGTRVIRLQDPTGRKRVQGPHALDLSATAVMAAISSAVLAATLLIASLSTVGEGRSLAAAQGPQPAPPPLMATPQPEAAPVTP